MKGLSLRELLSFNIQPFRCIVANSVRDLGRYEAGIATESLAKYATRILAEGLNYKDMAIRSKAYKLIPWRIMEKYLRRNKLGVWSSRPQPRFHRVSMVG